MSKARWPRDLGEFLTFAYAPERWARKHSLDWTEDLQQRSRMVVVWLYHRAGVPTIGPDGRRIVVPVKPRYAPTAPWVARELNDVKYPPVLSERLEQIVRGNSYGMIETDRFMTTSRAHLAEDWHPPEVRKALHAIEDQASVAASRQWRVCPLCGRAFPRLGNTKACPPCRRRWTRRQIQWRLVRAPKEPITFRYFNPREEPQAGYLHIASGVRAPHALRRFVSRPIGSAFRNIPTFGP
jgi:hypothetical protein